MKFSISRLSDLFASDFDTLIDVRAPSEFADDHLPGAVNLPVLSDEERARVGTIYVQDSPFRARKLGAALVAKNAATHLEGALADKEGSWRPLVYCWRGGQRSGSFASILEQIGWRVAVLEGGYKSYRRLITERLYDQSLGVPVILLDGNTGTGKTELLKHLVKLGSQVLDLEGLANHRGSVLGAAGDQPSQKMFESALAWKIHDLNPDKPVIIEAESSRIGALNLPPQIFNAMRSAPRIEISAPLKERARYLAHHYADLSSAPFELSEKLKSLTPLQGHERVSHWIELVQSQQFEELALDLIQHHYDPRYAKTRQKSDPKVLQTLTATSLSEEALGKTACEIHETAANFTQT